MLFHVWQVNLAVRTTEPARQPALFEEGRRLAALSRDIRWCALLDLSGCRLPPGRKTEDQLAILLQPAVFTHTTLGPLALEEALTIAEATPGVSRRLFEQVPAYLAKDMPAELQRKYFFFFIKRFPDLAARMQSVLKTAASGAEGAAWYEICLAQLDQAAGRNAAALARLAVLLPQAGLQPDQLIQILATVQAASGQNPLKYLLKKNMLEPVAESFARNGSWNRAWSCYQFLMASLPRLNSQDRRLLAAGRSAWHAGQPRLALPLLMRFQPPDPDGRQERYYLLSLCWRRLGKSDAALSAFRELARLSPGSQRHQRLLQAFAYDFELSAEQDRAADCYRELIRYGNDRAVLAEAHWKLAWIERLLENRDGFHQHMLTCFELDPGGEFGTAALYWMGRNHLHQGRLAEGRQCLAATGAVYSYSYYAELAEAALAAAGGRPPASDPNGWVRRLQEKYRPAVTGAGTAPVAIPGAVLQVVREAWAAGWEEQAYRFLTEWNASRKNPAAYALAAWMSLEMKSSSRFIYHLNRACPDLSGRRLEELPRPIWEALFPRTYESIIRQQLRMPEVEPELIFALIRQESAFQTDARSVSNAIGLMQMLPSTAIEVARLRRSGRKHVEAKLRNPQFNLENGCLYFQQLLKRLDGRIPLALAAYNGGETRVRNVYERYGGKLDMEELIEMIPMTQSRQYVKAIFRNLNYYRRIYRQQPADLTRFLGKTAIKPS